MTFIHVMSPQGRIGAGQRRVLAKTLTDAVLVPEVGRLVPEARRGEIYRLLAMVNEQLWLGHFDLWSEEGLVMYRDGLVLSGGAEASGRQCEALLENAVSAAERYYPAFQFVIWAGKTAREAMDATLFETAGEA